MNKMILSIGLAAILMMGAIPIVAEAVEEVPWAHILDHEVEMDKKPTEPGKPPKDDPPEEDPPTDNTQTIPWGIDRIDADTVSLTGEGIKVAVLDTGIDKNHPDLSVAGGVNFVPKGLKVDATKWDDDNGHGTHVAGTIAALDNSSSWSFDPVYLEGWRI